MQQNSDYLVRFGRVRSGALRVQRCSNGLLRMELTRPEDGLYHRSIELRFSLLLKT